jgi:hypothetical protein
MECCSGAVGIVRKAALITLIGFGVVVLSGPAIAVVGALLPFAVVGGLVWLVIQTAIRGPRVVGNMVRNGARVIFALPLWVAGRAWGGIKWVGSTALGLTGLALAIVLPTVAGAVLGGVLGVIGGMEHQDIEGRVPAGIAIGAGIGVVAGIMRRWPTQKRVLNVLPAAPRQQPV